MDIFTVILFGTAILGVSCGCGARDDTFRSCAVCNRGYNLACTAERLSKQLPDKWPGTTDGNILCPAKRNLLKGIQKQESHLAAIHVLSQYTGHLLQIYKKTQTEAAMLYKCTSNERINDTLTKIHDEDLNWPDNKSYNITLSSEATETMNAKFIFKQIKGFGECLQGLHKATNYHRCVKALLRGCGKSQKRRKGGRKRGKGRKGEKGRKAQKDGKKKRKDRRRKGSGRTKTTQVKNRN